MDAREIPFHMSSWVWLWTTYKYSPSIVSHSSHRQLQESDVFLSFFYDCYVSFKKLY